VTYKGKLYGTYMSLIYTSYMSCIWILNANEMLVIYEPYIYFLYVMYMDLNAMRCKSYMSLIYNSYMSCIWILNANEM